MKTVIIIYAILATAVALFGIGYVIVESLLNRASTENEAVPAVVPTPIPEPIPEPEPEPEPEPMVMPFVAEEIDAIQADVAISDALAIGSVKYERGMGVGAKYFVNIGDIDKVFSSGDTVTIDGLKAAGLIPKKAKRVKILADGILHKPLTVKAEAFSVQAIKMIELTGGTVVILHS